MSSKANPVFDSKELISTKQAIMGSSRRVLLLFPASGRENYNMIPLSLLYVAGPLVKAGFDVEIIDQRFERNFFGYLKSRISEDLICVGLSCITGPQIDQVVRICEFLRQLTTVPIVLGGPHVTILPEQTLRYAGVDYVVTGKGEAPFLGLIQALKEHKPVTDIGQLGYKADGHLCINRRPLPDIPDIDLPYHLVYRYGKPSVVPVLTSFGCPHRCSFCAERVLHPCYSEVPLPEVVNMIEKALRFSPSMINFIDDTFLAHKQRIAELFSTCRGRNIRFPFICMGRVDEVLNMDGETVRRLRKNGMVAIYFGIESGSETILKLIKKKITPDMALELNRRMLREGITAHYSFMAGFPSETEEDVRKTIELMRQLKRENPTAIIWKINTYTPYPGTELFDFAVQHGFKPPQRFEDWSRAGFYSQEYGEAYDVHL
ncbi:MAG: B12-binding domain-containing radical SAM protein [Syntrophaceae bacterium]|nr:B12-binding domain-containing radical SAM protein [Syntrophaceae bacterium]